MHKLILHFGRITEFLSFLFTVKSPRVIGSLFVHYAQKFSFFACLLYGAFIFLGLGLPAITWKILLSYIAIVVITTEVVFVCILARAKFREFLKEILVNMSVSSALIHILLPLFFLAIGLFAHQFLFIGKVSNGVFGQTVNIILMAGITGILYPLALASMQMGIIRLCLIGKEKNF
jgi:hypothetical protein